MKIIKLVHFVRERLNGIETEIKKVDIKLQMKKLKNVAISLSITVSTCAGPCEKTMDFNFCCHLTKYKEKEVDKLLLVSSIC